MPRNVVQHIEVFSAHAGEPNDIYDARAQYDDWDELMKHVLAALRAGRNVLIERKFMTEEKYTSEPPFPDNVNPLLK